MSLACPGRCKVSTPGDPVWCPECARIIRSALVNLPQAYEALKTVRLLTRTPPLDATRVSGSRERPSPDPGVDLMDETYHTIRSWEDDSRTTLHHRAAREKGSREGNLLQGVRYLNRNFEALMQSPDRAGDFGSEVDSLFARALSMVKNGPLRAFLKIPCHYCGRKSLIQREGIAGRQWYTACEENLGGCGRLFTETEMAWAAEVQMALVR